MFLSESNSDYRASQRPLRRVDQTGADRNSAWPSFKGFRRIFNQIHHNLTDFTGRGVHQQYPVSEIEAQSGFG